MASTGRMKIFPFLLFVLFKSGTSTTSSVNITARVGQNVSLPCILSSQSVSVVQMQWHREMEGHQQGKPIVVYNLQFGKWESSQSKGTLGAIQNPTDQLKRFYLDLEYLEPEDSGVYVCGINAFPSGTITQYVNLQVEAKEDKDRTGQPLTTEVPVEPQRPTTSSSSTAAIKVIFSTALTTGGTTAHSDFSTSNNESDASSVSISSTTSSPREPQTSTKSPLSWDGDATATTWIEYKQNTTYDRQNVSVYQINATTVQRAMGTRGSKVNNISVEESTQQQAGLRTQTTAAMTTVTSSDHQNHGNYTTGVVTTTPDNSQQYLSLIIILPFLALLLFLGLLYRRNLIRKRMDGPPSFKPPPPPVKYTSMRVQHEILMRSDILV
ncbi:T-cell surface protein tactile [Alosa sapidissima]|uniref:T-cell surface protein tactile n=1 Tax=Alosa sapidissima TaxID=34773 RepID=UPI001C0901C3|nr:T-cell surface protein tactile [Alosa sapidissima]